MQYCTKCARELEQKSEGLLECAEGHQTWVNPIVAAVVYIVDGDKVLFGVRSREPFAGGLNTPGGFLELHETIEQAAHREAMEEMGVEIEIVDYLGSYVADYNDGRHVINVVYVTELVSDRADINPGDDMAGGDPVWRDITDLPSGDELSWKWQLAAQTDLAQWHAKQVK